MDSLLLALQALEVELHHPGSRSSRARLERLLHPQFREVGRSGRRYDRATVIAFLETVAAHPDVESGDFSVDLLAPDVALLTYRSAQRQPAGALARHTHRVSLWMKTSVGWQLRYHQGTPADETG